MAIHEEPNGYTPPGFRKKPLEPAAVAMPTRLTPREREAQARQVEEAHRHEEELKLAGRQQDCSGMPRHRTGLGIMTRRRSV